MFFSFLLFSLLKGGNEFSKRWIYLCEKKRCETVLVKRVIYLIRMVKQKGIDGIVCVCVVIHVSESFNHATEGSYT